MTNIVNNTELYKSLILTFFGYEEYIFYNKKEYKESFLLGQKLLQIDDKNHPLYYIVQSWKVHINDNHKMIHSNQIYLTNDCNLSCKHCYVNKNNVKYMSLETFKEIVNRVFLIHNEFITQKPLTELILGGGECTLNPDFKEILLYSLQRYCTVKVLTNGISLSDDLLELFKSYSNKLTIQISIDGLEETHDYIRGKGTFKKTIETIKKLCNNNINVNVELVSNNINYMEYSKVYSYISSLGVKNICSERYVCQQGHEVKHLDNNNTKIWLTQGCDNISPLTRMFITPTNHTCLIGKMIVVDWEGNIKSCVKENDIISNIFTKSIQEIVKDIKILSLERRIIPKECIECNEVQKCIGGEKCIVKQEYGNYHTIDRACIVKKTLQPSYKNIIYALRNDSEFLKYCNCIRDRFGFFEQDKIHQLPIYNETTIHTAVENRVKELGEKNILWSGGIDSTYIICAYIKQKIPFNVVCDINSINDNPKFYNWMIHNNIPIIQFNEINRSYPMKNLLSGYMADTLFSSNTDRHFIYNPQESFYSNIKRISNRDELYENLLKYASLLKKDVESNEDFIKLINYGIVYTHYINELTYYIFPKHRIQSFFNTKTFNDIAWTQYWNKDGKSEFKNYISDVTEDDSYTSLEKNPCKIRFRKPLTQNNYIIPYYNYD